MKFKRYGRRELSDFMAELLVNEIASNEVSAETRLALNEKLQTSAELRSALNKETLAANYFSTLSDIKFSQEGVEEFQNLPSPFSAWLAKVQPTGWTDAQKTALEVMVVTLALGLALLITPWDLVSRWAMQMRAPQVTLAELSIDQTLSQDEPEIVKIDSPNPEKVLAETPGTQSLSIPATPQPVVEDKQKTEDLKNLALTEGKLFRATLESDKVAELTPALAAGLVQLGATKAGEVELGWKRVQGSYFHFLLPKTKIDELNSLFAENGFKLRLREESHPRKVPTDQMRIIINLNHQRGRP